MLIYSGTLEEELLRQQELSQKLLMQQSVPVALGSGKQGLRYAVHAALHSTRLLSKSWRSATQALNSTITWVGDLGEVSFTTYKGNTKRLMGAWCAEAEREQDAEDNFEFIIPDVVQEEGSPEFRIDGESDHEHVADPNLQWEQGLPEDEYDLDLTRSIYICGPHHVLNNMTNALSGVLLWWEWFVLRLRHVRSNLSQAGPLIGSLSTCTCLGFVLI